MSVVSKVSFVLNGKQYEDVPIANPSLLLLDYLQSVDIDLCGTKYGCGEGGCGACSLLVKPVGSTDGQYFFFFWIQIIIFFARL